MPELCRFFGMIITMFYDDHAPPHFHVRYGEHKAIIAIESLARSWKDICPRVHWVSLPNGAHFIEMS